jgi:hypothetical protein
MSTPESSEPTRAIPPAPDRRPPTDEEVMAWIDSRQEGDWYGSDLNLQEDGSAILVRSAPGKG